MPPSPSLQPSPLETLVIPSELDGSTGSNRAVTGRAQIAANNDLDAIRAWLSRFTDTRTTFENYRKEAERLLLWSFVVLSKPFSSLTHEDCLRYQHFLTDPQPAATWVAGGGREHARSDARWRPFYGPLSPASQRQAIVILNALFSWLVRAGYLAGNPLSLITRYLEPGIWQEVKDTIAAMPRETEREIAHATRVRWLFTLLYLGGQRIAEVGANTMGQFFVRRDADGAMRWWLTVHGKGGKERLVPATREMMTELSRYRQHLGLSALPSPNEDTPLVLPIGATAANHGTETCSPLSRAALHAIVKAVFAGAAARLREHDRSSAARADLLEKASAHWLRHSAGSHMADQQVDLRLVRDNLGHASLTTTSLYLHVDDDRRHRETDEKHRIDW
ncbi:tyrosine-type recombinase/integrase [Caballeronia sp. S22]|uniref:tyrosine-type recombinase/integrase n=1 Tax=Caballeronia sp. S22 TaxID=3137182 RepID=UPI00353106A2